MALIQIAYASRPFGFDAAILSNILLDARRLNARDNITGALIARHDLFLQMLEGPEAMVDACYQRICRDDRHLEITTLLRRGVDTRLFPGWAMRDDPAESWIWSMDEVKSGAVACATEDEVLRIFERLASTEIAPEA
ncbi:BLUF domain-containing protein [Roseovarius sp. LXJ103]|uniref:BLUF domain-containing protein n=1 Tax=Roseovarius carneus TaxID=2853164 RepID=UPI000D618B9C|nr:BLUF domain-containing protein [Roseovarius carneus]MBZ8118353.1 BLUF domain-containing protein [Roseovarius carneus]PWE35934.1 blue light sensor protein [Pelagicola sp. LXJ1103]